MTQAPLSPPLSPTANMTYRVQRALLAAGFLLLGPHHALAQEDIAYTLRPGDKVTIEVFTSAGQKVDVVTGERRLDRNGDVYLPFVGTVHVAGLDQNALREILVANYAGFYAEPVVNVKVELLVNLTGAVAKPGQYFLDPTATLIDALAAAGGANSEFAVTGNMLPGDARRVQLVRDGARQIINLHPAEVSEETLLARIRSGDWIHVPPETKSAVRDQVLFWGSLLSLTSSVISLVILLGRG